MSGKGETSKGEKSIVAEILIIGNELVSADINDSVASFLSEGLLKLGINIERTSIIGDEETPIKDSLKKMLNDDDVNLLIIAGGIGPESGFITSRVAARVTKRRLVISNEILAHIKSSMQKSGEDMSPSDERQALIPQKAEILKNPVGPSCGYILRQNDKTLVFLPGNRSCIRAISENALLPLLGREVPEGDMAYSKVFHTFGLSEEAINELVSDLSASEEGLEAACLTLVDEIALKVTARGRSGEERVKDVTQRVRDKLGDYIFAEDSGLMEETVGNLLSLKGESLSLAESCTGGGIGDRITNVPGSSDYFEMGLVTYSDESKTKLLGVDPDSIDDKGAVSAEVAIEMALGARRLGGTSYGLSVTGIAGPGGGSEEKPVGTVFIGLSSNSEDKYEKHNFSGTREDVKKQSAMAALDFLRRELINC